MHVRSWIICAGDTVLAHVGTGTMNDVQRFIYKYPSTLMRPCGLCFDDAGYLYVTSLTDQVVSAPMALCVFTLLPVVVSSVL